jgi:hypothetical protein
VPSSGWDRRNNHRDNLAWRTSPENIRDKITHATLLIGDRHPSSKLNSKIVIAGRALVREGRSIKEAATALSVNLGTLKDAIRGRSRRHIGGAVKAANGKRHRNVPVASDMPEAS